MKQVEALNPLEGLDSEAEEKRKQLEEEFSYDGYKYVRGELFANLREPAITIRNGNITFNTACINGLEDVVYVNLMINEDMKRLVVKGCKERVLIDTGSDHGCKLVKYGYPRIHLGCTVIAVDHADESAIRRSYQIDLRIDFGEFFLQNNHREYGSSGRDIARAFCNGIRRDHTCSSITFRRT